MHLLAIIPLCSFVIILFVWFYIWAGPTKTPAKRAMLFFAALDLVFLGFELLMFIPAFEPYIPIFFLVMSPFWIFLGFGFLNFVYRWIGKKNDLFYYLLLFVSLAATIFFVVSGKVHLGHIMTASGAVDLRDPLLHALVASPSVVGGSLGLWLILNRRNKETDRSARKIHEMILIGGSMTMSAVVMFDVILPDFFGTQHLIRQGSSMFVFFILLVFYAVRRYRFLHFDLDDVALPLFEEMQDAVFWVEDGTRVRKMNRAARTWFNVDEGYEGTEITQYLPYPNKQRGMVKIGNETRWLKVSSYTTKKNNLEVLRVFIARDVTEVRRAREVLRRMRDELEKTASKRSERLRQAQRLEALATLSGGIAHEFNNLLTTTMGYTSVVLDDLDEGDPIHEDLLEVMSATERARDIIKQMLSFSDEHSAEAVLLDVAKLMHEALKIVNIAVPPNVVVSFEFEGGSFTQGDPTRLHQAMVNLLTNSLHAMEGSGGELKVHLQQEYLGAKQQCVNTILQSGKYVSIQVSDTGCGIAQENLGKVFEPFFTTKKLGRGTGIGLATVFRVVEEHNGGIQVHSELNKGTLFKLLLPLAEKEEEDLDEPKANTAMVRSTGTVLLVDDNPLVIKVTKRILEPLGFVIDSFEHPEPALKVFAENAELYDLALIDFGLPQMDGLELTKRVREVVPDLPVVMFSGKMTPSLSTRATAEGIQSCLSKPLSKRQLGEAVSQAWQRRRKK